MSEAKEEVVKHTPGPWTRCVSDQGYSVIAGYLQICELPKILDAECEANARLIAAAPDLLAALEGLIADDYARAEQIADDTSCCHSTEEQRFDAIALIDARMLAAVNTITRVKGTA